MTPTWHKSLYRRSNNCDIRNMIILTKITSGLWWTCLKCLVYPHSTNLFPQCIQSCRMNWLFIYPHNAITHQLLQQGTCMIEIFSHFLPKTDSYLLFMAGTHEIAADLTLCMLERSFLHTSEYHRSDKSCVQSRVPVPIRASTSV